MFLNVPYSYCFTFRIEYLFLFIIHCVLQKTYALKLLSLYCNLSLSPSLPLTLPLSLPLSLSPLVFSWAAGSGWVCPSSVDHSQDPGSERCPGFHRAGGQAQGLPQLVTDHAWERSTKMVGDRRALVAHTAITCWGSTRQWLPIF